MQKLSSLSRRLGPTVTTLIIGVMAYLALFVMLVMAISPERYDIQVGEVAKLTITASKDVEDTITTQQRMDEAEKAVQPHYVSDAEVMPKVLEDLDEAFTRLESIRSWGEGLGEEGAIGEELLNQAAMTMSPVELTQDQLVAVMSGSQTTMNSLSVTTRRLVREVLTAKLPEGQEDEAIAKISRDLQTIGFDNDLIDVAASVVRTYLLPNMLLDEEITQQNRQKAREAVEPVVYKKGQNIVRAGEVVTGPQIEMLNSLGMIKNDTVDFSLYLGVGLLLLLLILVIAIYISLFEPEMLTDARRIGLLSTIVVVVVALSLLIQQVNTYLMPVTLGVMLTALLLKPRLALITNIVLSVLTGLLASVSSGMFTAAMFCIMLTSLISGSICIAIIRRRQQRTSVMLAGLAVGLTNMVTTIAVGLINNTNINNVFVWALWSVGSGVASAVLCIGLQPALEWAFNLVTSAKLLELSNPNQPLIRRLLLEAPGTYHHSIIVANLAEAAASAVGANGLLARVGAYYHDVGKLKRPMYFKENQMGDNPHDRTDPRVSTAILTAHPRDGVVMAQKHRVPQPILEIIQQHHGDTPVAYFYGKAVKQVGEENVDIADFRYDGPLPHSREAAIVMLADTVEAAARALPDPNYEKMEQLIRKLVRSKMEDGQLDDCTLTFIDLDRVCKAFLTVLTGVFHERIEYPNVEIPPKHTASAEQGALGVQPAHNSRAPEQASTPEQAQRAEGEDKS